MFLKFLYFYRQDLSTFYSCFHDVHILVPSFAMWWQDYKYFSVSRVIKSRRLRWAGHVARMEGGRSFLKILTGTTTGKRPLGRPRRMWEHNIRIDRK